MISFAVIIYGKKHINYKIEDEAIRNIYYLLMDIDAIRFNADTEDYSIIRLSNCEAEEYLVETHVPGEDLFNYGNKLKIELEREYPSEQVAVISEKAGSIRITIGSIQRENDDEINSAPQNINTVKPVCNKINVPIQYCMFASAQNVQNIKKFLYDTLSSQLSISKAQQGHNTGRKNAILATYEKQLHKVKEQIELNFDALLVAGEMEIMIAPNRYYIYLVPQNKSVLLVKKEKIDVNIEMPEPYKDQPFIKCGINYLENAAYPYRIYKIENEYHIIFWDSFYNFTVKKVTEEMLNTDWHQAMPVWTYFLSLQNSLDNDSEIVINKKKYSKNDLVAHGNTKQGKIYIFYIGNNLHLISGDKDAIISQEQARIMCQKYLKIYNQKMYDAYVK